jgi:hypothetical protein
MRIAIMWLWWWWECEEYVVEGINKSGKRENQREEDESVAT